MQRRGPIHLIALLLPVLFQLILFSPKSSLSRPLQAKCNDVADRGYLSVLTINLLFSEVEDRMTRLQRIADFAAEKGDIDVILLQEVVGGFLSGTLNSSLDLWYLLAVRGLHYNLSYRLANGLPNLFFSVGNAILTRCQILGTLSRSLPFVTEEVSDNIKILLRRNVMMSAIFVPGFGMINLFNTHLCAFCSPEDRLKQAQVMIDFIEAVEEALMPGEYPAVLGGDFNTAEASSVYESITTGFGFVDTYAAVKSCSNCCSDPYDPGCTYGVPGYPYAVNPFTGEVEDTVRIDYIFTKGEGFNAAESEVVFNINPNWVSDHSGVLTKISLTR